VSAEIAREEDWVLDFGGGLLNWGEIRGDLTTGTTGLLCIPFPFDEKDFGTVAEPLDEDSDEERLFLALGNGGFVLLLLLGMLLTLDLEEMDLLLALDLEELVLLFVALLLDLLLFDVEDDFSDEGREAAPGRRATDAAEAVLPLLLGDELYRVSRVVDPEDRFEA